MNTTIRRFGAPITFEAFATAHGLEAEICEREMYEWQRILNLPRFYARLPRVEAKEGDFLRGVSGDGSTPEEALLDLGRKCAGALLVVDAYKDTRREIQCPREWAE